MSFSAAFGSAGFLGTNWAGVPSVAQAGTGEKGELQQIAAIHDRFFSRSMSFQVSTAPFKASSQGTQRGSGPAYAFQVVLLHT